MPHDIRVSVIIPCRNAGDGISHQLEALARQEFSEPWEVVIVDNGCDDNTLEVVMRYQNRLPSLRVADASDRKGRAHACNVGAREAIGEKLLFCDADDEVGDGWLEAMNRALIEHDFVACGIDVEKLNPPWLARTRGGPQKNGLQTYWYPPYMQHAGGGTLGVKRSLHERIGGFDESWMRLQDTDYCWRIQLAGTTLHFVPEAVIHIRCRDTYKGICDQAYRWGAYNVRIYKKYRQFGMPKLTWKDGARAWVDLARRLRRYSRMDNGGRASFLWAFSWRVGRLWGCLRYRVIAP